MLRRYVPFVIKSLPSVVLLCLVAMALVYMSNSSLTYVSRLTIPFPLKITILVALIVVPLVILYMLAWQRRLRDTSFTLIFLLASISTVSLFMLWQFLVPMLTRL